MRTNKTRLRHGVGDAARARPGLGVAACGSSDDSSDSTDSSESGEGGGAIVSNPDNGKVSLTIGSKNFPEQEILGEIYAQALAAAGYKVKSDLNLGSETVALQGGQVGCDLRLPGVRQHGPRPRSSASNPKKFPPTPEAPRKRRRPNSKRKA